MKNTFMFLSCLCFINFSFSQITPIESQITPIEEKEDLHSKAGDFYKNKKYSEAIAEKNLTKAKDLLAQAESKIARAAGKGLFKKNTASRKVSRLTEKLLSIQK